MPDVGATRLNRRALVEDDNIVGSVPGCSVVEAARQNDLSAAVVSIITMPNVVAVAVGTRRAIVDDRDLPAAEVEDTALARMAGIVIASCTVGDRFSSANNYGLPPTLFNEGPAPLRRHHVRLLNVQRADARHEKRSFQIEDHVLFQSQVGGKVNTVIFDA